VHIVDETEADVGKRVVYDGDTIGRVVAYDDGTAYMEPDPNITDFIRSQFAWGDRSDEAVPLQRELVTEMTDDEGRLVAEL